MVGSMLTSSHPSAHTKGARMYNRILIATDGSELSDKAVDSGLGLAALCGASVVVVQVVQHYPRSYFEGGETVDLKQIERIEGQWTSNAQTVLDAIHAKGQALKVNVTTEIVMASNGRKGLQRLLLGSETQHVLTHTHIPVLVLR